MTDPQHNEVGTPGSRIGARLAKLVADASVYTRQRMAPHAKAVALSALGDFTDLMSDESKAAIGPLIERLAESPDLSPEARALVDFMARKRGQWQALAAGSATGAAFGGGLINLLTNELNPGILRLIAANPNNVLSPEAAASAKARGLAGPPTWDVEANKGGIDDRRFDVLVELATAQPAPSEVLDMVNRGTIGENVARDYLRRNGYTDRTAGHLLALRRFIPSPADLAAMWNRSIVSTDEGARLAAESGVSEVDWHRLTELGGEPLAPQALAEAFRRGFIDKARYNRGIVQGPIRNEWFDVLEKLSYSRMSPVDAADAVNQGHMSAAAGREVAKANGLDPKDFETLLETAGAPPGIALAQEALNRGLINEATFDQMFLESRIKNRYLSVLKATRFNLIPAETVRLLYRYGVYPRAKTLETLQAHGYTDEDAAAMVALEEVRQTDTSRDLSQSQITKLYTDRAITLDDATTLLMGMGYSEENTRLLLELADLARVQRYVTAATSRVHAAYVAGRIDEVTAGTAMDRLGVTSDQRDDLLALWDLERGTVSKGLTTAQITAAVKKGFLTYEEGVGRIVGQGYADDDAAIILQLAGVAP